MPQRKSVRSRKSPKKSVLRSRKSPRKYRSAINFVPKGKAILLLRLTDVKNMFEDNKFELFDIKNLIKIIPKFLTKTQAERDNIISLAKSRSEKMTKKSTAAFEKIFSCSLDEVHFIEKCKKHLEQTRKYPVGYFTSLQKARKDVPEFQKYIDWVTDIWSPIDDDPKLKEDLVTLLTLYKVAIQARGDLIWTTQIRHCIRNLCIDKIDMINAYPKFPYPSFL